MKREIYITLFALLGLLVHYLLLGLIEIWYITHTLNDFSGPVYMMIASAWIIIGAAAGFFNGKFFWQKIYVEKVKKENVLNWLHKKR